MQICFSPSFQIPAVVTTQTLVCFFFRPWLFTRLLPVACKVKTDARREMSRMRVSDAMSRWCVLFRWHMLLTQPGLFCVFERELLKAQLSWLWKIQVNLKAICISKVGMPFKSIYYHKKVHFHKHVFTEAHAGALHSTLWPKFAELLSSVFRPSPNILLTLLRPQTYLMWICIFCLSRGRFGCYCALGAICRLIERPSLQK